jgi:plastocyanin
MKRITGSLAVCVAAGLFTAGTLLVNPSPSTSAAPVTNTSGTGPSTRAADGGTQDGTASGSAAGTGANASTATLTIEDFSFSHETVASGTTVSVVNRDSVAHTATAASGEFDAGTVAANAQGSFVAPSTPGTYALVCQIHPQMSGELIVR